MRIVFVSNFVNHHQVPLCDELCKLTNGLFWFIETEHLPVSFKKSGYPTYNRPYIVRSWESDETKKRALSLSYVADVVIAGGGKVAYPYIADRLRDGKLTLEYAERTFKKGWINFFSPTNLHNQLYYHLYFYDKPFYKLCASAFTANDMYAMHSFRNRCFKFGYYPAIASQDADKIFKLREQTSHLKMIWCARFVRWKHPEMVVKLGARLKNAGFDFEINMVGGGILYDEIKESIVEKKLTDRIHLLGNHPNSEVLNMMAQHDVFLFTSDRNEGWGVVLNEAMGQLCCPVASDQIGSVPYLLSHNKNGLVFRSKDDDSLYDNVLYLMQHHEKMIRMSIEAYHTVKDIWCPHVAAERLYKVCDSLLNHYEIVYKEGPLSKAYPINSNNIIVLQNEQNSGYGGGKVTQPVQWQMAA